jgi:hypothetical protein
MMKDFYMDCMNYAISSIVSDILGGHILRCVFTDDKPHWLRRYQEGHVLPWMTIKRTERPWQHVPVLMHRCIVSLRVQTHTVK